MDRIKNLKEIVVRGDHLFCKVFGAPELKTKAGIILPKDALEKQNTYDYLEVISVGKDVSDVEVGDIVLSVDGGAPTFDLKDEEGNSVKYNLFARYRAEIIVKPTNFDPTKKKEFIEVPQTKGDC